MAVLYLNEQQAWVGREGECLVVRIPERDAEGKPTKQTRKKTVPLLKVEEVIVLGDITLSTQALAALLEVPAPVTYFTRHGRYLGSLNPALSKNSLLRLAQHAAHADPHRRIGLARGCVLGKLRNMRTVLMRYNRVTPDPVMDAACESLRRCIGAARDAQLKLVDVAIEESEVDRDPELEPGEAAGGRMRGLGPLLGCEGAASAAYFGVFGRLIKCNWAHGFERRVRRPPTDPVNAMLSYGYTILSAQMTSAVAGVGLDPYIGYLHSSRYGKPALALDLLEEFRPLIVDSVVLGLLNNRQVGPEDFTPELNSYRMTDAARRRFLEKFEERMQEPISHPLFEYKATYRRCIELQARLLGKYLLGEVEEYVPFTVR
ncbi:MAG: type I-D CRISPR-associated endonuclease Cas1d [Chloroflexia bacterium]